jgi:hypothetical protein
LHFSKIQSLRHLQIAQHKAATPTRMYFFSFKSKFDSQLPNMWCALKFWSWDIRTPWLCMGNDMESKTVNIFTCYIDSKQWINHLKTTNYRDINSSKIALHLTGSRPKVLGRVSWRIALVQLWEVLAQ